MLPCEEPSNRRCPLLRVAARRAALSAVAAAVLVACSSSGGSQGASGGTTASSGGVGVSSSGGASTAGKNSSGGAYGSGSGGQIGGPSEAGSGGGTSAVSGGKGSAGDASGGASRGGTSAGGKSSTSGGGTSAGGQAHSGGATNAAGASSAGGVGGSGGAGGSVGVAGSAGTAGAAGGGPARTGPCDIYAAANTPCVAAHSTVRALFKDYAGPLYQVRRASDKAVKDIPLIAANGFADVSVQDSFCSGTTCTISVLYDQTSNKNDLLKSPVAHWLANGGNEANAANGKTTVGGHIVHGIYVTGYNGNVAYRNNATKGVAKGDQAEAMYMVVDGKRFSDQCCFDYGNAETSGNDDGNGTMEAVYFGSDITWGGKGDGNGPWIAADLENGVFKSNKGGWQSQSLMVPNAKSIIASFVTAMLKGPSGNQFTLKGGSAQSGTLVTMWNGARPSPGYSPKKLQGAIILGTGGDGSNGGTGTFYEGAMTMGNPSDSIDDAVQANIVAAGYGR